MDTHAPDGTLIDDSSTAVVTAAAVAAVAQGQHVLGSDARGPGRTL
jgi:hypothetical protein